MKLSSTLKTVLQTSKSPRVLNFQLRTWMSTDIRRVINLTKQDIVSFNDYILMDADPEPWVPVLRHFFGGDYKELIMLMGRKSGKSVRAAKIALFYVYKLLADPEFKAQFKLVPGQPIYIICVSTTAKQAEGIVFEYIKSYARGSWYLKNFITKQTKNELHFVGNIIVRAQGASSRATLGYPCIIVIFDELAHFVDTRGNQSGEAVYEALKPNIALFGDHGRIIILTTPGAKTGIVWKLYQLWKKGELRTTYCLRKPTWEMNPNITQKFLDDERSRNPLTFDCEYGAKFYDTIDAFLEAAFIDKCAIGVMLNLDDAIPRMEYFMTLDPGQKIDSYSLAIGHIDEGRPICDYVKKWEGTHKAPVDIETVENFVYEVCKKVNIVQIGIDQFQSASTIQNFAKRGLPIEETPFTSKYNMLIYERLRRYIYNPVKTRLVYPTYGDLISELKMLQIKHKSDAFSVSAPRGFSDDCEDVLANLVYIMTEYENKSGELIIH